MRTDFMGSIRVIFCSNCTQPQLWYGVALRVVVACLLMTSCSQKYKADERDKSHLWSDHSQIAVGGRENYFSLSFDSHLSQGTSHVSSTFHSKCLASAEEFTVDEIEVWGFVRESQLDDYKAKMEERKMKYRAYVDSPTDPLIVANHRRLWFEGVMRFTRSVCHFTTVSEHL